LQLCQFFFTQIASIEVRQLLADLNIEIGYQFIYGPKKQGCFAYWSYGFQPTQHGHTLTLQIVLSLLFVFSNFFFLHSVLLQQCEIALFIVIIVEDVGIL